MIDVDLTFSRPSFSLRAAFRLQDSGITVLRGDSGSGKTTLADLLSGALAPASGRITADGAVWFDANKGIDLAPAQRGIGFVFQTHRLFPNLTVEENIRFPVISGHRTPRLSFEELVALLGIEALLKRRPSTLSGGESQRAALARALMGAEKLLILDEPLASLDPGRRESFMDFIRAAVERAALPVLYITHSERETQRLADRLLYIEEGVVVEKSQPAARCEPPSLTTVSNGEKS